MQEADAAHGNGGAPPPPAPAVEPLEAEAAVLGALLNDERAWERLADLAAADFTHAPHRLIFGALQALERRGSPVDLVTASEQLRREAEFDQHPQLLEQVRHLAEENFTSERIEHYVRIVLDSSVQRRLRAAAMNIVALVNSPEGRGAEQILNEAERLILEVSDKDKKGREDFRALYEEAGAVLLRAEERYEWHREHPGRYAVTGVPTGFGYFDEKTSGLQRGELVILAGSPSSGKTSLAMNVAFHVAGGGTAGYEDAVVAVFSMEMSSRQLAERMLAMVAGINQKKLLHGRFEDAEWRQLERALNQLREPRIFVHEISAATPSFVRRAARRLKAQHGRLDLVIIDYLQLMPSEGQTENRNTELAAITRALKSIAGELDTPVLCLSQLNRLGSKREAGDAPRLQELRDSGAIEQDADLVLFIYGDAAPDDPGAAERGIVRTIFDVAKNRNGPVFKVPMIFTKEFTRFREEDRRDYAGEVPAGDAAP